ncbi:hypothetical protein LOTGIDRAFT_217315 [Lottia gigantea]|uniref:Uncharacterized protein n=1 Tax=Lottia gigantea TaxID=225164 RepID=V3ZJV3_LOTGI|nr:hypothetical protein LOTGIDRAFT_217315 [Lottia gigantea]ESO91568.1 hypothetical protein LOTGIDRAFT_217315 [Lottia gigantea]
MASLKDKVIIITGASSGIGRGIAVHLAKLQPKLALCSRDVDKLNETRELCQKHGLHKDNILVICCDLTIDSDIDHVIQTTVNTFKQIDSLINNAGIGKYQSISNTDMKVYDEMMNVNVRAPFYFSKVSLPYLKQTRGTIVNISSILGQTGLTAALAYSMGKASLDHFTRVLAADTAEFGVRVNCVSPGFTKSEFSLRAGLPQQAVIKIEKDMAVKNPLGRVGEPDDVAKLVQFLISDDSSYITGEVICVDGGSHMRAVHSKVGAKPPSQ